MKRHPFNMVEIALALGVAAVAIVSIMALFPIGFSAGRDAMAETYAAEIADEFAHFLEGEIRHGGWTPGIVPTARPAAADFTPTYAEDQTLYPDPDTDGLYKAIRYVDVTGSGQYDGDGSDDILDFAAIITVNRARVAIPGAPADVELEYDVAVRLEIEISWPARLDDDRREKRQYFYEIFNRN